VMDLRGICDAAIQIVNPDITVLVIPSTGFTIDPTSLMQVPTGGASISGPAQLQAMSYGDLKKIDGLNIQGVVKAIYLKGSLSGVVRPNQQGGDLVFISPESGAQPQDVGQWLVVKVLENWPTWTKAAIQLQGGQ
jgi:hypothetical protein